VPLSGMLPVDASTPVAAPRRTRGPAALRPTRPQPTVGASATIWHFGGEREAVTIVEVGDGGRVVVVVGADGGRREFTLRRATAAFVASDSEHSPRLEL
jgi:hypothetical protein